MVLCQSGKGNFRTMSEHATGQLLEYYFDQILFFKCVCVYQKEKLNGEKLT